MNDLRTSLHRVADAVEPLPLDDDLWQRGVIARRRGQAVLVAAVLAIVVSVAWSAVLLGTEDREARTASTPLDEGAIPRSIVDIDPDLDRTSDLAVGRASVAFISATDDPVVITATDGVPHRLALPGWDRDLPALALSPDGRTLAFQHEAGQGTQVDLLDLDTGLRSVLLVQPGDRLKIDTLTWSPGGDWLGWAASRIGDTPSWAGTVRPGGSEGHRFVPSFNAVSAAVADDGTLALGSVGGAVFTASGAGQLEPVPVEVRSAPGVFSPDNQRLALGTAPGRASYTVDVVTGQQLSHPFPSGTIDTAVVRPLGWMDDRLQLLLVQEVDGDSTELVVTTPEVDETSTWRRRVGAVDASVASSLSLAVDLVPDLDGTSSQELTYDFPAPAERDISWIIGLGVAAAIAVLMALRWLWRRLTGR